MGGGGGGNAQEMGILELVVVGDGGEVDKLT